MKTRKQNIDHHLNLIEEAMTALLDMKETPDTPINLSSLPIGALDILSKKCGVDLLFSGDNVFGIMGLSDEDLGRGE